MSPAETVRQAHTIGPFSSPTPPEINCARSAASMRGCKAVTATQKDVLPDFGGNNTVVKYVDSLYAYLKGRAAGDIPATDLEWKGPKTE